jgi:hypothetical protein
MRNELRMRAEALYRGLGINLGDEARASAEKWIDMQYERASLWAKKCAHGATNASDDQIRALADTNGQIFYYVVPHHPRGVCVTTGVFNFVSSDPSSDGVRATFFDVIAESQRYLLSATGTQIWSCHIDQEGSFEVRVDVDDRGGECFEGVVRPKSSDPKTDHPSVILWAIVQQNNHMDPLRVVMLSEER